MIRTMVHSKDINTLKMLSMSEWHGIRDRMNFSEDKFLILIWFRVYQGWQIKKAS